jgi:hypothetical protein
MAREMVDMVAEKGIPDAWLVNENDLPIGIEVKTRVYDLMEIQALMQDYHKENHAGKLVLRISQDL